MALVLPALILLVLIGGVNLWAGSVEKRARAEFPPEGRFLSVDGTRIHYVERGAGPVVILLHGAGGSSRDFTFDLMDRLADTYRVIAFDRPGLGYSDRLPGYRRFFQARAESLTEQALILSRAARMLGVERAILVGHSFGGAVALRWAIDAPDQVVGLVGLGAVSNPWEGGLSPYYPIMGHPVLGSLLAGFVTTLTPERVIDASLAGVFAPQAVPDGYGAHFGVPLTLRRGALLANARQVQTLLPQVVEMVERYGDIKAAVELLHGDADITVGPDIHSALLAGQIPDARLTRLPGVGHMPHHADPGATLAAIDRAAARAGLRSNAPGR